MTTMHQVKALNKAMRSIETLCNQHFDEKLELPYTLNIDKGYNLSIYLENADHGLALEIAELVSTKLDGVEDVSTTPMVGADMKNYMIVDITFFAYAVEGN